MGYTNLCRAYNDTKLYQQAVQACTKALGLNPGDGESNFYLARAYDMQNKPDVATPYYKKAVDGLIQFTKSNPEYSDGFYLLGNAYFANDQRSQAIAAYKRSLEISPKFAKARYNLGFLYHQAGDKAAAREQYESLKQIDTVLAEKLLQAINK
jgi:superkiller protein 3